MAGKSEWVDWQNTKVLQKAVVVDENGSILSIKRSDEGKARPGKWDLPGGSLSPDDLVEGTKPNIEAIKREIKEETGLVVEEIEPVFVDSGIKHTQSAGDVLILAIGYKCRVQGTIPEITLSSEHTEYKWGSKEEILSLDFGDDGGMHVSIINNLD